MEAGAWMSAIMIWMIAYTIVSDLIDFIMPAIVWTFSIISHDKVIRLINPVIELIEGWSRKRTRWKESKRRHRTFMRWKKVKMRHRPSRRMHYAMTAMLACSAGLSTHTNTVRFDTDSH